MLKDRYRCQGLDDRFAELLDSLNPDIVHIGHLNHLSTSLLREAAIRQIPIVYTLHDYWLMCPRGQFMQMFPEDPKTLWAACDGQEDQKCAERCYARYFSGSPQQAQNDVQEWSQWVSRRMSHIKEMCELVDLFVAPARYLMNRYATDFGLPLSKMTYLDYGFDRSRLQGRQRIEDEAFTFGYIGTHIPAKGIHVLIEAFGKLTGEARLNIWERERSQNSAALRALVQTLPEDARRRIHWKPEYKNQQIVTEVFNHTDAIVVPSIWVENSPLVIHEAQQARVPVITADVGGMAEYVHHEVNGLQFVHRNAQSLAEQMQRLLDDPELARSLGNRGYVFAEDGNIPGIQGHTQEIESLYAQVLRRRNSARVSPTEGPWRITFDTNPDDCNLKGIMCEEHSQHSQLQVERKAAGRAPRRMSIELVRQVLQDSVSTGLREIIPSTMGEPLLFKDFEQIIDLCHEYGVMLNLTTNGTFPRLGARAWAERIVPVTSDTKISWNGATAKTQERIMVGTRWNKVLDNLRTFIEVRDKHEASGGNRCRVTLQITFLEANVGELPDIVKMAAKLGVDRVKGHHLWAHFGEIEKQSMRRSPEAIARWNEAVVAAREVARLYPLSSGEPVLLENFFELDADAPEDLAPGGPCPFLGQEAWVSALGRFNPCCAPDAQRKTLGDFGDLNQVSIQEVWHGEHYQQLLSSYRNRALCLGCNMRKPVEA